MASIRRGYSDDFTLKNNSVGIGTSTGQEALDVVDGAVKGQDLKVTGISSFTAYEGFLRADHQITENTTLSFDQGPSASLSGEIIVGTGQTVTVNEIVKETAGVGNGSGDQWFDINGNHAFKKTGTPTWNGNTFTLDGTDDYFTASGGDKDDFGFGTGDFTIEMWINATDVASIVPYDTRPASTNGNYTTLFIDSTTPNFYVNGANRISGSSGDFAANVWNHFVVSRISSTTKMYINGVQKGSDYSDSTNYLGSSGRPFIGAQSRTVGNSDVTGQISIVRVYKGRGLTAAEVTSNYNAGYTATTSAVAATVDLNANVPSSYPGTVNTVETTDVNVAGGSQIECMKVYNTFTPPSGDTNQRPSKPKPGQLYYNYDFKTIEFHDGYGWRQVDNTTQSGRGIFGGGADSVNQFVLDKIQIMSLGNSVDFGRLRVGRYLSQACGNNVRSLFGGGYGLSPSPETSNLNAIDYVTPASGGNAIDFGNLTQARRGVGSCSSSTRGIFWGGNATPATVNTLDYVELGTLGNAIDFHSIGSEAPSGNCAASATRGVRAGAEGEDGKIQFVTFSSTGSHIDFGDDTHKRRLTGCCSNSTRMLIAGGYSFVLGNNVKEMSYITMSSQGNAIEFGDLTLTRRASAVSTQTRGVFGNHNDPASSTVMDYVNFSTLGDAQDFGDATHYHTASSIGASDSHGGLGGF